MCGRESCARGWASVHAAPRAACRSGSRSALKLGLLMLGLAMQSSPRAGLLPSPAGGGGRGGGGGLFGGLGGGGGGDARRTAVLASSAAAADVGSDFVPVDTRAAPVREPLLVVYGNIQKYWGSYVVKEFYAIVQNLTRSRGWHNYIPVDEPREDWATMGWDLLTDFGGRTPDVMLVLQDFTVLSWPRKGTPLESTVVINWVDDLPIGNGHALAGMKGADVLLTCYEYLLQARYPALNDKARVWFPHSAMPHFHLPYNRDPVPKVLLVGSVDATGYPGRFMVLSRINMGDDRFAQYVHPGWHPGSGLDHQVDFARAVNHHLAAICDGSNNHFLVGKSVEVPATGALLLMTDDVADAMEGAGFVAGTHYLAWNAGNLDQVVDWVLEPENRRAVDRMRAAGQRVALARHTTAHRVDTLHAVGLAAARARRRGLPLQATLPQPFPPYKNWTTHTKHGFY